MFDKVGDGSWWLMLTFSYDNFSFIEISRSLTLMVLIHIWSLSLSIGAEALIVQN